MNSKEEDLYNRTIELVKVVNPDALDATLRDAKEACVNGQPSEYFKLIVERAAPIMRQSHQYPNSWSTLFPQGATSRRTRLFFEPQITKCKDTPLLMPARNVVPIGVSPPRSGMAVDSDGRPAIKGDSNASAARVVAFNIDSSQVTCPLGSDCRHEKKVAPNSDLSLSVPRDPGRATQIWLASRAGMHLLQMRRRRS